MHQRFGSALGSLGVFAAALLFAAQAHAITTVTFSGKAHGEIVDTDFAAQGITSINTTNFARSFDHGVMFDTTLTGTSDSDLEDPWSGGNLPLSTIFGNVLIIQENNTGCGDDICDNPDDEGTRPAGEHELLLAAPIALFGLDIIDIDDQATERAGGIRFFDGGSSALVSWQDLVARDGIVFGDNFINRIAPLSVSDVNTLAGSSLSTFDKIVIEMGGSGGIDNLVVPEPATGALLLVGAALLAAKRRRA